MLEFIDRRGSNCYKWDSEQAQGTLPLWVADMDFKAAPCIIEAMQKRLNHGVFGYNIVPDDYYQAVSRWFSRQHGWEGICSDQLIPVTGVVPAISAILRAMQLRRRHRLQKSDSQTDRPLRVLTLTPAYNCFFTVIDNLEMELLQSPLIADYDEQTNTLHYEIDWADFADKSEHADVFLLCNPHNPTGRAWTPAELSRLAELCRLNHVFVVSDEIHCEFCFPDHTYTPFATIAGDTNFCTCTSASKAFNIAGLQCANIFIPDTQNRLWIERAVNIHEVGELNAFGIAATIAAYTDGKPWLDELNSLVHSNYTLLADFIRANLPQFTLTRSESTYLAWLRLPADYHGSATEFCEQLRQNQHVLFNPSDMYGAEGFVRINLATSSDVLLEALSRLQQALR